MKTKDYFHFTFPVKFIKITQNKERRKRGNLEEGRLKNVI